MPKAQGSKSKNDSQQTTYNAKSLENLLALISNPKQLPALENVTHQKNASSGAATSASGNDVTEESRVETASLEKFWRAHEQQRKFSDVVNEKYYKDIFRALIKHRLNNGEWMSNASCDHRLSVLLSLRILLRDVTFAKQLYSLGGVKALTSLLKETTDKCLQHGTSFESRTVDTLKELTNIFQKLSNVTTERHVLVEHGAVDSLVLLLSASDIVVVHCTLHTLVSLAHSPESQRKIAEHTFTTEMLLQIIQTYDNLSKKLAASLLRLLCAETKTREDIKVYDGIPILLSQLRVDGGCKLLFYIGWCLVQLLEDDEVSHEIRQIGGIPLLLSLLQEKTFISDRATTSFSMKTPTVEEEISFAKKSPLDLETNAPKAEELQEHTLQLKATLCACVTELVRLVANAQQVVQDNGIYILAQFMFPAEPTENKRIANCYEQLQANAFRTLRYLFSLERNRRFFKMLFPAQLFAMFIDIGHYKQDIKAYRKLVHAINALPEDDLQQVRVNTDQLNIHKAPSQVIGAYSVFELLGTGAFGSVFKVTKSKSKRSNNYYAMKEVQVARVELGKSAREKQESVGDVMNELAIIRKQLKHPNIVKYIETFRENEKLYIVMELIEGAPLGEHFNSLKEKKSRFTEDRIWKIFIQLVLALRYLHKEKNILHRDLTPNNIMLGEEDKVTITDFGLAKQKQKECSHLRSVVGTILYWCPELVQSKPYGDKADVWALGCILYQMCTLNPPFFSSNMYQLVNHIVEAKYDPIPEADAGESDGSGYSYDLISTVKKCIETDVEKRPDIVGVAAHIADKIMLNFEQQRKSQHMLERKLEKEKRRTQIYHAQNHRQIHEYHKLYKISEKTSEERIDHLDNLKSSGGASSVKDCNLSPSGYSSSSEKSDRGSLFNDFSPIVCPDLSKSLLRDATHLHSENYWDSSYESPVLRSDTSETEDDMLSSESDSRESSAGSYRSHSGGYRGNYRGVARKLPMTPGYDSKILRRPPAMYRNPEQYSQQLEIACISRDSGIYSADPSPNHNMKGHDPGGGRSPSTESRSSQGHQSDLRSPLVDPRSHNFPAENKLQSTPEARNSRPMQRNDLEGQEVKVGRTVNRSMSTPALHVAQRMGSGGKPRPTSAKTAKLTISSAKVREVSDPILQMFNQLHKILYICQLPPSLHSNPRRHLVEKFKRSLFAPGSDCKCLKLEIQRLQQLSRDQLDLNMGHAQMQSLLQQLNTESSQAVNQSCSRVIGHHEEAGLTYERLHGVIESLLQESGYYALPNA